MNPYGSCSLPTGHGEFLVEIFQGDDGREHTLLSMGDLATEEPVFVRVHSECFTGEVLGSLRCDCGAQLDAAMRSIGARQRGAIVYLRQEGRGIGLGNKIRAYAEQDKGADTIEANEILGFPADLRDFTIAAVLLARKGVRRVELNTNNPDKVRTLRENGIEVARVIPSTSPVNAHNLRYLRTKYRALGHAGLRSAVENDVSRSG